MRFSTALACVIVGASSGGVNGFVARSRITSNVPLTRNKLSTLTSATVNGSEVAQQVNGAETQQSIRLNVSEKARTVTATCTSGTLCTTSSHEGIEGAPFGSHVDYVLDDNGYPVLLMNEMSMHTINIREAEEACKYNPERNKPTVTLFMQLGNDIMGSQDVSRCSLTGTIEKLDRNFDPDMDTIRMRYSITHSYADQVMDSPKFNFYRIKPLKIYFVGGYGVMAKWVTPEEYLAAKPDILAKEASDIVQKLNREHEEDLILTARHLLDIEEDIQNVRVTNVDRLGMGLRVTKQVGSGRRNKLSTDEYRFGFRIPVISVEDAKSEVLKIFQEAWERGNGYTWQDDELPGSSVPVMKTAEDSLG